MMMGLILQQIKKQRIRNMTAIKYCLFKKKLESSLLVLMNDAQVRSNKFCNLKFKRNSNVNLKLSNLKGSKCGIFLIVCIGKKVGSELEASHIFTYKFSSYNL